MNFENTEHHEDQYNNDELPNVDEGSEYEYVEEKKPLFGSAQKPKPEVEGGLQDRGFLDPADVGYLRSKMDMVHIDVLAEMLGVSPGTARKIVKEETAGIWYQEVGRRIEIPRQSVETLVVRTFKKSQRL